LNEARRGPDTVAAQRKVYAVIFELAESRPNSTPHSKLLAASTYRRRKPRSPVVMRFKPHVTVAAIAENAGRFLMVRERIDGHVRYNQPAGHLEEGESLHAAVVRETLEETAWHFRPQALIGLYRWIAPNGTTFLRATFCGEAERHESARGLDSGIEAAEWLSLDEIRALGEALRSPLVLRCIEDYRAGIRHSLELLQDL
jgi:8-oxo-dGTP pyrophosphatase MutT (NUDIX family)